MNFNSPEDRALSEHRGSALLVKKASGKYSIFLPIEETGETGSAPQQIDKTAIGNRQATSVEGRTENPQKQMPFFAHRDNLAILESVKGKPLEFLRLLPDFTGFKYSGTVNYSLNSTGLNAAEAGQITITPTSKDEYVENCYDLVEDTVVFTTDLSEVITLTGTESENINVTTNPADATVTATSDTEGVATVKVASGKVTITAVSKGSAIIKLTASKENYASFDRTILVIVE